MKDIKMLNYFVDLVASTDASRSNDLLLVINGESTGIDPGGVITLTFNGKKYISNVLSDETWFVNILNDDVFNIPNGKYDIYIISDGVKEKEYEIIV